MKTGPEGSEPERSPTFVRASRLYDVAESERVEYQWRTVEDGDLP